MRYATKAKNGTLSLEEMSGGTFTISNGGVFGSLFGTPIINPPQSAILGMHGTFERPVAINGQVEVRPIMYVALSYSELLVLCLYSIPILNYLLDYHETTPSSGGTICRGPTPSLLNPIVTRNSNRYCHNHTQQGS